MPVTLRKTTVTLGFISFNFKTRLGVMTVDGGS